MLAEHSGSIVFMKFHPEIFDFTDPACAGEIQIYCQDGKSFGVTVSGHDIPVVMSLLKITVFDEGRKLLTWNVKQLFSFVLAKTGVPLAVKASIIDLKILESYNGHRASPPSSFGDAMARLRNLVQGGGYRDAERVYRNVSMPLVTTVLPRIETLGALDVERGAKVHPYYEIDGQENGRLKCHDAYRLGFVPHTMGPAVRSRIKPLGQDEIFMCFDFRGMEVYALAHLSCDRRLSELCRQPDVYAALYEALTGERCSGPTCRDFAKKAFLPVIYGQGAASVAATCGLPAARAESMVRKIRTDFAEANEYVMSHERQLSETGFVRDCLGKVRRSFPQGKDYLARNFAVQAPASVVCLEKLINLHFSLKGVARTAYTVHDGYVLYASKQSWREVFLTASGVLAAESTICPGLRLKVTCRAGRDLNNLRPIRARD